MCRHVFFLFSPEKMDDDELFLFQTVSLLIGSSCTISIIFGPAFERGPIWTDGKKTTAQKAAMVMNDKYYYSLEGGQRGLVGSGRERGKLSHGQSGKLGCSCPCK
jgi:hypothetical protein